MAYVLLIAGVLGTAWIVDVSLIRNNKKTSGKRVYIAIWGIILILICGLRRIDIGRDTIMYHTLFNSASKYETLSDYFSRYHYFEYGYYGLNYIFSKIGDYQLFLIVMAVLSIAPPIYVIGKYSNDISLSLILFICFPYFTFCMSGMRQAGAIGIICLAYDAMKRKQLWIYLLFCLIAMSFHTSAILFIPVYWIDKVPYNKYSKILCVIIMVAAYVLRQSLWLFISQFARQSYRSNDAGGFLMYIFMILTVVLGFYYSGSFREKKLDHVDGNRDLFYLQVLSVILWPIASLNSALFRMYFYYHIFIVLYVPSLIGSIKNKIERMIVYAGFLFVSISFLVTQVLPVSQAYNPYYFFWQ